MLAVAVLIAFVAKAEVSSAKVEAISSKKPKFLWTDPDGTEQRMDSSGVIYISDGSNVSVENTNGFIELDGSYTAGAPVDTINVSVTLTVSDVSQVGEISFLVFPVLPLTSLR
jgi:hypothetical protein